MYAKIEAEIVQIEIDLNRVKLDCLLNWIALQHQQITAYCCQGPCE